MYKGCQFLAAAEENQLFQVDILDLTFFILGATKILDTKKTTAR